MPASAPTKSASLERLFGDYQHTIDDLWAPAAVAVDSSDRIFVADSGRHRICVFDAQGKPLRTIGSRGSGPAELCFPSGLSFARNGELYVSDSGNHRIVVFGSSGRPLRQWGEFGSSPGQLIRPMGLAVANDHVNVADYGNDRVQVFDLSGKSTACIGEWGSGLGQFQRPVGVAVNSQGQLNVLDQDGSRLTFIDAGGPPRIASGQWGPFPGMLAGALGICEFKNQLFVADTLNHRVQVFDEAGRVVYQWGIHAFMPRDGKGKLHYPSAIAIAHSRKFAVVCEGFENRCQIFGAMPPGQTPPTSPYILNDPTGQSHFGVTAGLDGDLMALAEEEIDQVSIHNLGSGTAVRIAMVGQHGSKPGQFIRPSGLHLDAGKSTLIVGDAGNRRLHEFKLKQDAPGTLRFIPQMAQLSRSLDFSALRSTTPELRDRPVVEPTFIRCDSKGAIFILDAVQGVLLILDHDLKVQRVWSDAPGESRWIRPTGLALSPDGSWVYVSDAGRGTVRSYSTAGKLKNEWKSSRLATPGGVAVASNGDIFVSDEFTARVFRFDAKGKEIASWGSPGLGAGQFHRPRGIMMTKDGRVLVIDHGNHRCQIFSPDGKFLNVFGATFYVKPAQNSANNSNDQ